MRPSPSACRARRSLRALGSPLRYSAAALRSCLRALCSASAGAYRCPHCECIAVSRALRFAVASLVVVAAAWAVERAHRSRQPTSESAAQVEGAQADVSLEPPPDAQLAAIKIPEQLPDYTLENRDGNPTSIAAWRS